MSEEHGQVIEVPVNPELSTPYSDHLVEVFLRQQGHGQDHADRRHRLIPTLAILVHGANRGRAGRHYVHLDADGITQLNGTPYTWAGRVLSPASMPDLGCPTNMPGHYHLAKGSTYTVGLEMRDSGRRNSTTSSTAASTGTCAASATAIPSSSTTSGAPRNCARPRPSAAASPPRQSNTRPSASATASTAQRRPPGQVHLPVRRGPLPVRAGSPGQRRLCRPALPTPVRPRGPNPSASAGGQQLRIYYAWRGMT
jgi:hypothetical protein